MRHRNNKTKLIAERKLPAVEKATSRYSTLGGSTRRDEIGWPRHFDDIWARAGVTKRKGAKRR
jgi:hypothetical protein